MQTISNSSLTIEKQKILITDLDEFTEIYKKLAIKTWHKIMEEVRKGIE